MRLFRSKRLARLANLFFRSQQQQHRNESTWCRKWIITKCHVVHFQPSQTVLQLRVAEQCVVQYACPKSLSWQMKTDEAQLRRRPLSIPLIVLLYLVSLCRAGKSGLVTVSLSSATQLNWTAVRFAALTLSKSRPDVRCPPPLSFLRRCPLPSGNLKEVIIL